jgi:hypothetical protein
MQSMVRAILMELVKDRSYQYEHTAIAEYLYLPMHLFIALSGSYDPLVEDPTSGRNSEEDSDQAILSARIAVGQKSWKDKGISGSSDYLKRLFGQDGEGEMKSDPSKGKGVVDADK